MRALIPILLLGLTGCVSIPKPGTPMFKDKSGLTWLAASDELAMNGCANEKFEFDRKECVTPIEESSPAARICRRMKARLPSEKDIEGLIRSFDHSGTQEPKLTAKGVEDLRLAFKTDDWGNEWIWTSTLGSRDEGIAVAWTVGTNGKLYENRYKRLTVRCVR